MTLKELEDEIEEIKDSLQQERQKRRPNEGIIHGLLTELRDAGRENLKVLRKQRKRLKVENERMKMVIDVLRERNF